MQPRLKTNLWVSATLRSAQSNGVMGMVVRKGDADAGGVLVVLRTRAGLSLLSQARTIDGDAAWMRPTGPEPVTDEVVDAYIEKRLRSDPDLWIVEFETADLSPPFEARMIG